MIINKHKRKIIEYIKNNIDVQIIQIGHENLLNDFEKAIRLECKKDYLISINKKLDILIKSLL